MMFINWWNERCSEMLDASPVRRNKMVKEVEIIDDEIRLRDEKIHGKDGL